ncbi:DUF3717 domain-containing protein [Pollutimonas sp. M17]|uniref:DUF3717 domain-containing protein n=1 Tax=Pollutimonas sp. M17 TaxID=2962065 RepID=UPI0021F420DC|nr:DUF3717 domain-containing protein [Pollutimonas sp. M17]UYO93606.1 DUF3717 domain-containing protein [Pollutimonas sp. M17]
MKTRYTLADLEAAINYWRSKSPSMGEELALCPQASALAEPYALMIMERKREIALDVLSDTAQKALQGWRATLPGSNGAPDAG